jgi:putative nucleotidyltransferase with HDIG domain
MNPQALTQSMQSFPSISGIAVKLLGMLDDPDVTPGQIEKVMRQDPGLTANLLKLSNSAYFGFAAKIGSVKKAIVMLGGRKLNQLVMASCVNSIMQQPISGYDLPAGDLWRHCLAVSITTEDLFRELELPPDEEAFTAALLHDIGKMALGSFVGDEIEQIESQVALGVSFEKAEKSVLGSDHAEIGARILEQWGLPPQLVAATRWHHDPDEAPRPCRLIDMVHVADVLCMMMGIGVGREGLTYQPSAQATQRLGLKTAHLEVVASRTLQWVDELQEALV